jgi:hypothetical protein
MATKLDSRGPSQCCQALAVDPEGGCQLQVMRSLQIIESEKAVRDQGLGPPAVVSPRRSHVLDASQYSSNDEALRLMVDNLRTLETDAVLPANYFTPKWPIRDIA